MEKSKSRDRPLLVAILVIAALNLIAIATIVAVCLIVAFEEKPASDGEAGGTVPLPYDLATEEDRAKLFAEFKLNYNSGDNEQLLSMFGEAYQLQLRADDFEKQISALRNLSPSINDGAYLYYDFERLGAGRVKFNLYFQTDTPKGLRELRMTFIQQGDDPSSLLSVNISS